MIQKYINGIAVVSVSVAKVVLFLIKSSSCYAYQTGKINNMFVQNIVIPKYLEEEKETKEREILTVEEVKKIEEYVYNDNDNNYDDSKMSRKRQLYDYQILFVLYTGLRIGEYKAVTYEDIDFYNKELHINLSITKIKDFDTGTIKMQKKKPKSKIVYE